MRGVAIVAGLLLGGCGVEGIFECTESSQCTAKAGGMCVQGEGCAYPDEACDSYYRFSAYALRPGECVPVEPASTSGPTTDAMSTSSSSEGSTSTTDDDSSTGEPAADCDGVDCSGRGACVMLDGAPECACDPTYYRVGLQCLEDPCSTSRCFFVDAAEGNDANDGSRDAPWATLSRIRDETYDAGDVVLLRRGRTWDTTLRPPSGPVDAEAPITIGAYGPIGDGAPTVSTLSFQNVAHVEARDLRVQAPMGVCVLVTRSQHVMLRDSELAGCGSRGIRIEDESEYTVMMSNRFEGMLSSDAFAIIDIPWLDEDPDIDTYVRDHHWIVDNEIAIALQPDNQAITVEAVGITDVKVVGNRIVTGGGTGIRINTRAWIVGNTVARGGDDSYRACVSLSGTDQVVVSGNLLLECVAALRITGSPTVRAQGNTFVHAAAAPAIFFTSFDDLEFTDNLLASTAQLFQIPATEFPEIGAFSGNWYADADSDCTVRVDSTDEPWVDWSNANGLDLDSTCAPGPIDGTVDPFEVPAHWTGDFWEPLVPDAAWERCDTPAGAFACDGTRIAADLHPIDGFTDNDGKGWEGPIEVRLRWPMTE